MNENEFEKLYGSQGNVYEMSNWTIQDHETAISTMYPSMSDEEVFDNAYAAWQYVRQQQM